MAESKYIESDRVVGLDEKLLELTIKATTKPESDSEEETVQWGDKMLEKVAEVTDDYNKYEIAFILVNLILASIDDSARDSLMRIRAANAINKLLKQAKRIIEEEE